MKLTIYVPVEKVDLGYGAHTFRSERIEAQPVRVIRWAWRHDKSCHPWRVTAWSYSIDVFDDRISPDAYRSHQDGAYRAVVNRALNKHWKPPVFPAGRNWVEVPTATV